MTNPPVSICIPVHNGARWIDEAIDSALAQTRADFELLVVENASTDGTRDLVRSRAADESRIRLECFDELASAPENHNRGIRLARGQLIKFLHADDRLYPQCVERLAQVFDAHPKVGFAFAPRHVFLDDPHDPDGIAWAARYGNLHAGFTDLREVNRGHDLLAQYLPSLGTVPYENWFGEPSAVMMRRECVERVPMFSDRPRQIWDLEIYLRLCAIGDVAFVDEPLCAYRYHPRSLSARNVRHRADWLDALWLLEGLLSEAALEPYHGMIRRFRHRQLPVALRRQLGRLSRGDLDLRPLGAYLGHRLGVRHRSRARTSIPVADTR